MEMKISHLRQTLSPGKGWKSFKFTSSKSPIVPSGKVSTIPELKLPTGGSSPKKGGLGRRHNFRRIFSVDNVKKSLKVHSADNSFEANPKPDNRVRVISKRLKEIENLKSSTIYRASFINDKAIQGFILEGELKMLEEKVFQLQFMMKRGVKMPVSEMVQKVSENNLKSLNKNIELLCDLLYVIGRYLLQEFKDRTESIGIRDISEEMNAQVSVFSEREEFKSINQALSLASEFFKDSIEAFKVMQRRPERSLFDPYLINKFVFLINRCRLQLNLVDEQYKIFENSFVSQEFSLSNINTQKNRRTNSVVQRLTQSRQISPKRVLELQRDPEKELDAIITSNLHKLFPQRQISPFHSHRATPIKALSLIHKEKKREVGRTLNLLEKCGPIKNMEMRENVVSMIREIKEDYAQLLISPPKFP